MDPSGGGLSKAAGEMLKEMEEAQKNAKLQQPDAQKTDGANFKQAMEAQKVAGVSEVKQATQVQRAANVLLQAKVNAKLPSTRVGATQSVKKSKVLNMLQGLVSGQDRMNGLMKIALSGKQMGPHELLAMQAGIYRFSQELELTSKVVEKATSGIKQTMNTQV